MAKKIIAGIIIGLIVGLALGYLVLPYFFPIQAADASGKIIQTKFQTWKTEAYITNVNTTPTQIADTQLSVATGGSSYLIIRFNAIYKNQMSIYHIGNSLYQISLTVNGKVNRTVRIEYFRDTGGSLLYFSDSLTMEYVTDPLPAGTYTIGVNWSSHVTGGSTDSSLSFCDAFFNHSRSLLIQEISL